MNGRRLSGGHHAHSRDRGIWAASPSAGDRGAYDRLRNGWRGLSVKRRRKEAADHHCNCAFYQQNLPQPLREDGWGKIVTALPRARARPRSNIGRPPLLKLCVTARIVKCLATVRCRSPKTRLSFALRVSRCSARPAWSSITEYELPAARARHPPRLAGECEGHIWFSPHRTPIRGAGSILATGGRGAEFIYLRPRQDD